MADQAPRLRVTRTDDVVLVELTDRKILDEPVIAEIADHLYKLVAEAGTPKLVVNFVHVTNMSSGALGVLITLNKRILEQGGQLRLCNIHPSIYEVFAITRLNEVFTICEDRESAIRELAS